MFSTKSEILAKTGILAVAALMVLSMVGGAAAIGSYSTQSSTESIDAVTLVDGETTNITHQVSASGDYKISSVADADGNNLYTGSLVTSTTDADGNNIVKFSPADADILYDANGDLQVEEGETLTVTIDDSTPTQVAQFTVEVDTVADTAFAATEAVKTNQDGVVSINTEEPLLGLSVLGDTKDVAEIEKELIFADDDMSADSRTAVVDLEDSEVANSFSSGAEEAEDGEVMDAKVNVNGQNELVYLNSAPSDADGDYVAVYNQSADQVEIDSTSDRQTLFVTLEGNDGYSFFDQFRIESEFFDNDF